MTTFTNSAKLLAHVLGASLHAVAKTAKELALTDEELLQLESLAPTVAADQEPPAKPWQHRDNVAAATAIVKAAQQRIAEKKAEATT